MLIDIEKCIGCGICVKDCPVEAIILKDEKAVINQEKCVNCNVCNKVCPKDAVLNNASKIAEENICNHCPIKCTIKKGQIGACQRYLNNSEGQIERIGEILTYEDVKQYIGEKHISEIQTPIITALGVGTTYPDCRPAPKIVSSTVNNIEVVTVTTEVPLSYSSIIVKVDTDVNIGEEGATVSYNGRTVGMLETEQYGSKIIHIGGVNRLTGGKNGFTVARAITEVANHKPINIKIKNGAKLTVQVGKAPIINGEIGGKMRVGCGSATTGIFANLLVEAADEVIVLDSHVTGQLSKHVAGNVAGAKPSGVNLTFPMSTPGRYFGDHGNGWGGTSIENPKDIIKTIDMNIARPKMTILITETTGQNGAMFEVEKDGTLKEIALTANAKKALEAIADTCEPSLVSAMYTAGSGGSARAGVCKYPIKLTQAVHKNKVKVTVGGVETFVMPGGGISFIVDVGKIKPNSFYWTPTPATICPLEYTMTLEDYKQMGGHLEALKPFSAFQPKAHKD